jgi:hypothetical protein
MQNIVYPEQRVEVAIPAGEKIAVLTAGTATIYSKTTSAAGDEVLTLLSSLDNGQYVSSAFSVAGTAVIQAGFTEVSYEVGAAPIVGSAYATQIQASPVAVNTTGAVSATALLGGIVTSTTAAAVAGTIPTGTVMDAAAEFDADDSFDWSVINTGPNGFTVTGDTGHTIVGDAVVATVTSGLFRTRKTAANTFVTYRLA